MGGKDKRCRRRGKMAGLLMALCFDGKQEIQQYYGRESGQLLECEVTRLARPPSPRHWQNNENENWMGNNNYKKGSGGWG
jgi:hypothetical protein